MPSAPEKERKNRSHLKRLARDLNPEVTPFDVADLFAPLSRHRQLSTSQLIGYGRRYHSKTRGRLGAFYHVTQGKKEHYLHRVSEEVRFADHLTTEDLHCLGEAGRGVLVSQGLVPDAPRVMNSRIGGNSDSPNRIIRLSHDFMASGIALDVEIGARADPQAGYESHVDIIMNAPETTRALKKPLRIPVTIDGVLTWVEPDALWGVKGRYYALEADKGGETVLGSARNGVILAKCAAYREIVASGKIDEQFGIDNLTVLFAISVPGRAESFKKAIGRKSTMFAVRADPRWGDFLGSGVPAGSLYAASGPYFGTTRMKE